MRKSGSSKEKFENIENLSFLALIKWNLLQYMLKKRQAIRAGPLKNLRNI